MGTRKFGEPKFKEDEEQLRLNFTKQVKEEENRFRQWESQLVSERDRLNKDLEEQHAQIKQLEGELEHLYQLHGRGTVRR
ncbi:hypothetical protein G6F53_012872 [Rhizopus delemar]|nr:hypothetical protein G6F53_012872 [Rhizopus delemar]